MPIVGVDGSFLYKKYKKSSESGKEVALPSISSPPVFEWTAVTAQNVQELADSIPHVSRGNRYPGPAKIRSLVLCATLSHNVLFVWRSSFP